MANPLTPNVPQAPGVPPIVRQAGSVQSTVVGLVTDAAQIVQMFQAPKWGLFDQTGKPILASSSTMQQVVASVTGAFQQIGSLVGLSGAATFTVSVGSVDFRQDYRIASAPQEQGAFLSYNKVQVPFDGRVTFLVGGTQAQRQAFLSTVQTLAASMTLYSLVMPDATYPSVNVTHFDFRRTAVRGVSLLSVDVWVEQVRVTGATAYSSSNPRGNGTSTGNTASPTGSDQVNTGSVQPTTPDTSAFTSVQNNMSQIGSNVSPTNEQYTSIVAGAQ